MAAAKAAQVQQKNPYLGLDLNASAGPDETHTADMRQVGVFETLAGKQQQIQLAAQVVKMILKIDDVVSQSS